MRSPLVLLLALLLVLAPSAHAQTKAVTKTISTNALTENFTVGSGRTITFASGSTLTLSGTVTWSGSTSLTTLGTIATGTWQGSVIAPAYLGTGSDISGKFLRGDGTWQALTSNVDFNGNNTWEVPTGTAAIQVDWDEPGGSSVKIFGTDDGDILTMTNGVHSFSFNSEGDLVTTGTITASNLTGTNTGDLTLATSTADLFGLTGQSLTADDPGADRLLFWDDSAGKLTHLTLGSNLSISDTTLNASGGLTNPMTSVGDLIRGGASGTPERFVVPEGHVLLGGSAGAVAIAPEEVPSDSNITHVFGYNESGSGHFIQSAADWIREGDALATGLTFPNNGLKIRDSIDDHDLQISIISDLTTDRLLELDLPDSDTVLTITGNATISGTNTGDLTLAASTADVFGLSGQSLTGDDPNADTLVGWDDSAGKLIHFTLGTGLSTSGTTLNASGLPSAGTAGSQLTSDGSAWASQGVLTQIRLVDQFMGNMLTAARAVGSGSAVSNGFSTHLSRPAAALQTGTTTTGQSQLIERSTGNPGVFIAGQSVLDFCWGSVLSALSDGTNTYTVRAGLETNNLGSTNDGIFFRYTDSVNSGNWVCVTRNGGVETVTNTSVAPTTASWQKMRITVNSAGTSVGFQIDGTTVATHTTNIPASCGYLIGILKSAGTTNRILYVSHFQYLQTLNTPW